MLSSWSSKSQYYQRQRIWQRRVDKGRRACCPQKWKLAHWGKLEIELTPKNHHPGSRLKKVSVSPMLKIICGTIRISCKMGQVKPLFTTQEIKHNAYVQLNMPQPQREWSPLIRCSMYHSEWSKPGTEKSFIPSYSYVVYGEVGLRAGEMAQC